MSRFIGRLTVAAVVVLVAIAILLSYYGMVEIQDRDDIHSLTQSRLFLATLGLLVLAFLGMAALLFREMGRLVDLFGKMRWDDALLSAAGSATAPAEVRLADLNLHLAKLRELEESAIRASGTLLQHRDDVRVNAGRPAVAPHEFRTPVHAVLGMSEVLLAGGLDSRQRGQVLDIQTAARTLLSAVDSLRPGDPGGGLYAWDVAGSNGGEAADCERGEGEGGGGRRVLVVDDSAVNLRVAQGILAIEGVECDTASSGEEAVEKVARADYALVLMDYMMPGMNGAETTRRIRKMPGQKGWVPIIAFTANVDAEVRSVCRRAGMNGFLGKPVERVSLRQVLTRWLSVGQSLSGDAPSAEVIFP